ncbi:MAG: hypothetical protein AB1646_07970 [Thermodesulfobacteriota bacterium]
MSSSQFSTKLAKVKELSFPMVFKDCYPEHLKEPGNSTCPNPSHEDNRPSFQVELDHGFCHAGCRPRSGNSFRWSVIDIWVLRHNCDFRTAVYQLSKKFDIASDPAPARKPRPSKAYPYRGEDGTLLFQVCRFEPKDFRAPRPDPNRPGEWVWNLNGTRRVLFGLPELLSAEASQPIIFLEGEKATEAAVSLGFVATCSPGGAGKWRGLVEKHQIHLPLPDRTVWLCPDIDPAGRDHMRAVGKTLQGFAKEVRWLDLPGLGEKQDLHDFVAAHGPERAREELLRLGQQPVEYKPDRESEGSTIAEERVQGSGEKTTTSKFRTLMDQLDRVEIAYFHDQFKQAWVCIPVRDHFENVRIRSGEYRNYLTHLFFQATGEGCGREVLQQAKDLCTARALFEGERRVLWYRSAWLDDRVILDLGGPDWKAIEITAEGWQVVTPRNPPFRRFSHMQELPEPERGGSVREVLAVLPIKDQSTQDLICVWLPSLVIPHIPRASLLIHGLQGSGKSFSAECLRALIDPSSVGTLSLSKDPTDLVQCLDHHFLPIFDNLSNLPRWASDVLCRATTGLGPQRGRQDRRDRYEVFSLASVAGP